MAPTDPFGLVGQVLDGQYRVDRYVGEGGFSVVYKAAHVGLNEPIAIKCLKLPPALGSALVESFVRRFRDESRLHYRLSQGNLHIVRSITSGTTTSPATSALVPYTVLEWLEGRSLADELNARRDQRMEGRPLEEVVKLLDSAIDAVAYAHAQGVVHRDLNPGNLFLAKTANGVKLKVLDFGVAKILADSALDMQGVRTIGNVQMFAPAYGAPEQFDRRLGDIGPWTDVYAIALLVLEVLTDRSALEGDHVGEFAMKTLDPARRPTPRAFGVNVGDEVETVLARAVSIAPDARPRDAGELWGMLKHAMQVDADARPGSKKDRAPAGPPREVPRTMRMDVAAHQAATSASAATQAGPWAPRSGAEALAATPVPVAVVSGSASADQAPVSSPPSSLVPPAIAAPSFAPPPPISIHTPITATLPPRPKTRRSFVVLTLLAIVVLGFLAAGGWLLWSRAHEAWRTPVTEQNR